MSRLLRTAAELRTNECAKVIAISNALLSGKLFAMGLLPGTVLCMVRTSPFGNAFYVKADGIRLALRSEEAASIQVEV